MNERDGNVAFKCTYNDGGEPGFVGFDGTCSDENITRNIEAGRRWCAADVNACREFFEKGFRGGRPQQPCYESQIVRRWRFGPGTSETQKGNWVPIQMNDARVGKVAVLTTRHPDHDTESKRMVFGVYRIDRIEENAEGEIFAEGNSKTAIRLSEEAAYSLPYWEFKTLPKSNKPDWGSHLFRYVSDREVTNFLHALKPYLQSNRDRAAQEILLNCCGNLAPDSGRLAVDRGTWNEDRKHKYGPRGEGESHRRLKELIARHPELLNLGPGRGAVEHRFVTGDRVDVLIEFEDGGQCVVEVEVKGHPPWLERIKRSSIALCVLAN